MSTKTVLGYNPPAKTVLGYNMAAKTVPLGYIRRQQNLSPRTTTYATNCQRLRKMSQDILSGLDINQFATNNLRTVITCIQVFV